MSEFLSPEAVAEHTGAHQPTPEQSAVIAAPLGPSAIVAGAGSGKTETMAARVVWLVCNGLVDPDRVLGLTFTRKAAGELAERVRLRLRQAARDIPGLASAHRESMLRAEPTVLTYDAFARRIVTEHGLRLGIEPSVETADAAALWQLAQRVVTAYDGPLESVGLGAPALTKAVVALTDEMAAHLAGVDAVLDHCHQVLEHIAAIERSSGKPFKSWADIAGVTRRLAIAPLVERFQTAKAEGDLMSFGDTLQAACKITERFPEVGAGERARYDVVMLDEYQDTSTAQALLLHRLFAGHPITAVGDPCQAIYGFRGASADTLAAFRRDFGGGERVPLMTLQTSFRNDEAILGLANAVSEPLLKAGAEVAVLRAGPAAGPGELAAGYFQTVDSEARAVAADVASRWQTDGASVAVLCRARSEEFGAVIDALYEQQLPVEVVGLSGLLSLPEVGEVVQTLRVLTRPDADTDLVQLLGGRRWRLGARDLVALQAYARRLAGRRVAEDADADEVDEASLVDALDRIEQAASESFSPTGWQRLRDYALELRQLRGLMGESLTDLVAAIERALGVDVESTVRDLRRGTTPRAALDQFTAIAHSFGGGAGVDSADAFLDYLEAAEEADRGIVIEGVTPRAGTVQVLTMHAAKGLEWDHVYIVGATERSLPGQPRPAAGWVGDGAVLPYELRGDRDVLPPNTIGEVDDPSKVASGFVKPFKDLVRERHEQEQRRLVYVAITRARHRLWMSGAQWKASTVTPRPPSEYLELVRDHAQRTGGQIVEWVEAQTKDDENPALGDIVAARWPVSGLTREQRDTRDAAAALAPLEPPAAREPLNAQEHPWLEATRLLLAERSAHRQTRVVEVEAPARLSASQLVAIKNDPVQFALDVRRPVPRAIAREADRGTLFHSWVEHRFGSDSLIDIDELPGAGDEGIEADASIDDLIAGFEQSEWAQRRPLETETGFDLMVDGVPLRGRLDAVFEWDGDDADYDVIDWKTGRRPSGEALLAAEVQLAVYRLAWARIKGVPPDRVRAGFFYVADGITHRPERVLDEAALIDLIRTLPEASSQP
ncbi:ATP-dependent DNA helicase [Blastococcus sp. Marseille-P5729]|uniref:ATP-dependent helicase n=1 Tax=Blastococcus sp. Marseille-P5729 TaxID=2086582 RepID=UPI000D0EB5F2|nr:ATP-dependent DNA helicase [Blastococcus sp. Marseille-P5729]